MKHDIAKLVNEVKNEYKVFAPINEKGNITFKQISSADEIELNYLNSKIPPKEILFPKMEVLFDYEYEGKDIKITERTDLDEKILIFGVRPCDTFSFKLLDDFFAFGKKQDEVFMKKKENSTVISIGCNNPRQSCFCTSVGGNPFSKDETDVFLADLGDKYLVEPVSEKGTAFIEKLSWLTNATDSDSKKAEELAKEAESSFVTKFNFDIVTKVLNKNFDHPVWKEISESCIGCSSCTFLCPTCTCFDVIDEHDQYNNRGRRIRIWDTCQSCLYTLETSGHNPRPDKLQRCRIMTTRFKSIKTGLCINLAIIPLIMNV